MSPEHTGRENKKEIQILLATFQSQLYLKEQLDSLLAQDYPDFQILIRDGGSTDGTADIIREYQVKYPEKIRFLGEQRATALENFSTLLESSDAELVMFCDHDDVWFPQKISRTLAKYRELEDLYGAETPILVFTDMCVTDRNLNIMDSSFLHYQHLDPALLSLNRLILQNIPSGNSMMVNRTLIELALPIPPDAVIHDHWLALTAAALGKIGFLKDVTLYYRQHENNMYGASGGSFACMTKKLTDGKEKIRVRFEQNIRQAVVFGERYGAKLRSQDREMLSALERWSEYGFSGKRKLLLKYHILKSGFLRNAGMFILV